MIKSGAKVKADKTEDGLIFTIYPKLQSWQTIALASWIVIWLLCGIAVFIGSTAENENMDRQLFVFVFGAFWLYFLFYSVRAFVWSRVGAEYVRIGNETLDYKRSWNSFGRVVSYDLQTIKNPGVVNLEKNTFAKTYHDVFWTIGGETIGFEYIGKRVAFGLKVSDSDAKQILRALGEAIRRTNLKGGRPA